MKEKYNKKYRVVSVKTAEPREVHNDVEGKICYPAYFKVGERGWFLCEMPDALFPTSVHRIHTSPVQKVDYANNKITVCTENTTYEFEEVCEDEQE